MKILITGTTGYIAKRLVPLLLEEGHELVCCVRDLIRVPKHIKDHEKVSFVKVDFLTKDHKEPFPKDIEAAYYLIHSMSGYTEDFKEDERKCAENFKKHIRPTAIKQVIYLSGITNNDNLSKHLSSRKQVEEILKDEHYHLTVFKAGIIVGSGSSSFEIIRDLAEKLPIMVTPKWLNTKTQPIAIRDVLEFLFRALGNENVYDKSFDIFSSEILTYKQMLLQFAEVRGLKRWIYTIPIMTPRLSSYWLFFVTSTSYRLAVNLVDSMKVPIIGKPSPINELLNVNPISYKEAVSRAFDKIEQNDIVSSWKDSLISGDITRQLSEHVNVPEYGVFKDIRVRKITDKAYTLNKIWTIGGKNGWYYANFLWKIRGLMDQLVGGGGLRRGRSHPTRLYAGDALDFWRVLFASKSQGKLLLYAEMKLPGEAWLAFEILDNQLYQKAIFRPKGIWGRLYWYAVLPFHGIIFKGLINHLSQPTKA